jgi:hypothetical protein
VEPVSAAPAAAPAAPRAALFNARTVAALVAAGIVGFLLFLLLTAYGGHLRGGGSEPRAHALSKTAIGFHGLVRLVELSGGRPRIVRHEAEHYSEDLLVVTVEERTDPERLRDLLEEREGLPTLVILPKWMVTRDPMRPGRVRSVGTLPPPLVEDLLKEVRPIAIRAGEGPAGRVAGGADWLEEVRAPVPASAQTASGETLAPLLSAGKDRALLAEIAGTAHYLLADPDLMNNHGLRSPEAARAAIQILGALNAPEAGSVAFDVTLNGYASDRSALRLAFEPPFLPLTIALFLAALLAGLHGAVRFGAPAEEGRAIAFGKSQLVENSAGLLRLTRREHGAGGAYAELVREAAAHESGAHLALRDAELDSYLDRVSPPDRPFSALAARARAAADSSELLAAARALFQWKKDLL